MLTSAAVTTHSHTPHDKYSPLSVSYLSPSGYERFAPHFLLIRILSGDNIIVLVSRILPICIIIMLS